LRFSGGGQRDREKDPWPVVAPDRRRAHPCSVRRPDHPETGVLTELMRQLMWRRRVRAARAWRNAERAQAAERKAAMRRLLDQAGPAA
jgi:hypothetical protein